MPPLDLQRQVLKAHRVVAVHRAVNEGQNWVAKIDLAAAQGSLPAGGMIDLTSFTVYLPTTK